jgi:excisionase family DNA binding protein
MAAYQLKRKRMAIISSELNNTKRLKIETRTSVTVKGISNYCLVSECTVRRWIKDGKISALRLPSGQYRITEADFRDFLNRYGMLVKEI